jgi:acyl carrier protein
VTLEQCLAIVAESFRRTASEAGAALPETVDAATPLVGPDSVLDSMALVSLILDVEQRLDEEAGVAVSLMNEQALSRRRSPFRSVGTLADYIVEVAGGGAAAE